MKRLAVFFLALVLTTFVSFSATAEVGEEITFRGIPWGANVQEFKDAMEGVRLRQTQPLWENYWATWNIPGSINGTNTDYQVGFHLIADEPNFKVAGYDIQYFYAYFFYGETEDGKIDRSNEAARFHMAIYTFRFENVESAYADLKEKLTTLYGEGEQENKESILWKGANSTEMRLIWSNDENNDYNYISIRYGKADMDEELAHIDELARQEQIAQEEQDRQDNADNTDGL